MNRIDIVIPCAGRAADLLRLLASIERECAASVPRCVASITLSDDRHTEALAAQVAQAHPAVRYVAGPARGPAANRNHGAAQGGAEWILFLDDDCYLECDLLAAYEAALAAAPAADVVEGAIVAVGERPNGNHHAPLNLEGGRLWSCNMLIRRAWFERLGGFDEDFPFACMEDVDLHARLQQAGARIEFARAAAVCHPWRSVSEREVTRQIVSHAIYAGKHPEFVRGWTWRHLARAYAGRYRQYRSGRFASIPPAKYRTIGLDLLAPLACFAVIRWPALGRRVRERHPNRRSAAG